MTQIASELERYPFFDPTETPDDHPEPDLSKPASADESDIVVRQLRLEIGHKVHYYFGQARLI